MRAVTVVLACCLVAGSVVAGWGLTYDPPAPTYYVTTEPVAAGENPVAFEDLSPPVQRAVRADLNGSRVPLESSPDVGSGYVEYRGQTYRLVVSHADPAPHPFRAVSTVVGSAILAVGVLVGLWDRLREGGHEGHGHGGDHEHDH
ncbi:MAG: hypothetical protein ABEJ70_05680 [Halobacteriaceae archaeon]